MKLRKFNTNYQQLPLIVFNYSRHLIIGCFIVLFLTTYLTFDNNLFQLRFELYFRWLKILWLVAFIFLVFDFYHQKKKVITQQNREETSRRQSEIKVFLPFLLLSGFAIVAGNLPINLDIFNLLTFLSAIYTLYKISLLYISSPNRPAWQHPTAVGGIIQGSISLGIAICLLLFNDSGIIRLYSWILLIILILQTLTIWSRFRFLSSANQVTYQATLMMLGTHVTLFGVRFIFGIAMPFVYLLWSLFIKELPMHPVAIMIIVGELSERILFFITALIYVPGSGEPGDEVSAIPENQKEKNNET